MTNDLIYAPPDNSCAFCAEHFTEPALGILEPEDQERFAQHLSRCATCRLELAQYDRTVELLSLSAPPAEPSPALRDRVIARAQADDQRPQPAPIPIGMAEPGDQGWESWGHASRSVNWRGVATLASLVAALLLVAIMTLNWQQGDQRDTGNVAGNSDNVQVYDMEIACTDCPLAPGGHIGADPEATTGVLIAWNLDPTTNHDVWCVNRQGDRLRVGQLDVGDSGAVVQTMEFPASVGEYDQIYVARQDGQPELSVAMPGESETSDVTPTLTP